MGLKLMQGLKIQDGRHKLIIPHFLAYKVLKSSISVTIRFNQAEYEIMIPFE